MKKKFLLLLSIGLVGCSTMSTYDAISYQHTVDVKVETMAVMSHATDPYDVHQKEIDTLNTDLQKAQEYDKHRPNNTITSKMWVKLLDPNSHLLGGFLKEWHDDGAQTPKYIQNKKDQVGKGFDTIIDLEVGKIHAN